MGTADRAPDLPSGSTPRNHFGAVAGAVDLYDLALAAIPLALVCGALAGHTDLLSMQAGVAGGGGFAALAVCYCLFLAPPTN